MKPSVFRLFEQALARGERGEPEVEEAEARVVGLADSSREEPGRREAQALGALRFVADPEGAELQRHQPRRYQDRLTTHVVMQRLS